MQINAASHFLIELLKKIYNSFLFMKLFPKYTCTIKTIRQYIY